MQESGQILEEPLPIITSLSKAQRRESAGDDGEGGAENRALRPPSAYVLRRASVSVSLSPAV